MYVLLKYVESGGEHGCMVKNNVFCDIWGIGHIVEGNNRQDKPYISNTGSSC